MRITIIALAFFCFCTISLKAQQTYSVKGTAVDSVANAKLVNTSVSVLNAKDSTLVNFTRADANGAFNVSKLHKGDFILLVTYPGYADYVERFTLDSVNTTHTFGVIDMQLKSRLLKEVMIKGTAAAIKIKGDTTEYNAAAFKIEPNSKVEDLLRQLPGIQVDKDGKITAQGQSVPKVLVDGEEFFGDDPTLVTKNIRADMVDKVQLYDKKSDQATFTGIDDGEKTKTINIKLKEDKKNGYFGKVTGGVGTDGYYDSQALFNKFKGKMKFSAYGTLSNTGKTGLGWEDNSKLGTGGNMDFTDDGGIIIYGGGGDDLDSFDGRYNGQGIPVARTGGLHYDNKWDGDKQSINTNYKVGSIEVTGNNNTLTQNTLPDRIINSNSDQTYDNFLFRQKLDAIYQLKIDTTSNLKLTVSGTLRNGDTRSDYDATSYRSTTDSLLNKNNRSVTNHTDGQQFNATAFYNKKFKKKGRTFSLNVNTAVNNTKSNGFLNSEIDYYNKQSQLDSSQVIDQLKTTNIKSTTLFTNATYTEPITQSLSLVLNYGISLNNSNANRLSYDKAGNLYNVLNDSLSSDYKFNQFSNQGGVMFNYKKGKNILNFGTKVAAVQFKQIDIFNNTEYKRNFTNWTPQASYQYKISQQQSLRLSYYGNPTQPTIDQIQPVRVNDDPLNITLGNPDLGPSFTHRFYGNYNSYKVLSGQSIWLNGSYSFTTNPIVNNITTDSTGKTTIQYLNLAGKKPSNYYTSIYLDRKISLFDMNIGVNFNLNGNTYYSLKNSELNTTKSNTFRGGLNINKYVQKKYYFRLNAGPSYTVGKSSLNPDINNNGRGFNASGSFNVYLPGKFQIGADGDYTYQAATQSFATDFKQFILNANITKSFLKSEGLKIILSGNDLLNQNKGFSRNSNGQNFTQSTYTTIKRYFMFSVSWDFSGFGKGTTPKAN
ncbi:outer membrane beta-barrel family protein [Mucilaginibacter segetis]|uniref:Outer membrane beta-barrel protein n=1 Tax=Mucilaginibacter segetis TaxID=2793071 RepID=A0A934PWF4_9SPHI|nr:outer membrane beta-barrel family protein [Mucilaginibacter segetis]MBK0380390.1 outer membrane beta-barrel protein [Mucilaginibacter segetis]